MKYRIAKEYLPGCTGDPLMLLPMSSAVPGDWLVAPSTTGLSDATLMIHHMLTL